MAISSTDIRILFTNYDITYFLNLAFCSEHFISIKHRILATFNINKKKNSDSLYTFNYQKYHFNINGCWTVFSNRKLLSIELFLASL